jgi:adenylate cyclase
MSALTKGLERYEKAPKGAFPPTTATSLDDKQALARQFPLPAITHLLSQEKPLPEALDLGHRREKVTVVLSDIVNFSSIVKESNPESLRDAMGQYYWKSREAVFSHGGMLDKFIGDAVLAVFGYPETRDSAPVDAIRFAQDLIEIGKEVLEAWQADLNAVISTGTRVGITTGDIWPINIGKDCLEVALLGDSINLAARLEKNCQVDRFLMDNRTHTAAKRYDELFITKLNLHQVVITAAEAKGQPFATKASTIQ